MKHRILIIDDDPDIVEATKLFLEYKDFEIYSETDPGKGVASFIENKPELIILDVMMDEPDEGFFPAKKFKKLDPEIIIRSQIFFIYIKNKSILI